MREAHNPFFTRCAEWIVVSYFTTQNLSLPTTVADAQLVAVSALR